MASRQYAVPVRLSFPAQVDGFAVKTEVEKLLSDPMVQGQLARVASQVQKRVGDYVKTGQLGAWVYFYAGSLAEAAETRAKIDGLLAMPIVRQLLASKLPSVTWRVGEPAAV